MIIKNKLSIIIPCYNCEETLRDSVDSIYIQNIKVPFEIIMVDDGSTDGTRNLIKSLSEKYKEIKMFFNQKNKGGGVTRNIAVQKSDGEIIFCLDSDDYLGENTLGKMVDLWQEKKCDGIIYEKSIKFKRNNPKNIALIDIFNYNEKSIPIETFFGEKLCPLFTVFLFTRESFEMIGGYPENHGFDTQGFGFRFFLNDLKVYSCPNTVYWHRVGLPKSYYVREYERGRVNHNWYLLLEEFLYIFEDDVKEKILNWNLNSPYMTDNMSTLIKSIKISDDRRKFIKNFSKSRYANDLHNKTINDYDKYWLGTYLFYKKNYLDAKEIFEELIKNGFHSNYIHIYLNECLKETKKESVFLKPEEIDKVLKLSPQGKSARIIQKIVRRLTRIFKKYNMNKYKKIIRKIPGSLFIYLTLKRLLSIPWFVSDFLKFKSSIKNNGRFSVSILDLYPCLIDKTKNTDFEPHYTYHPAWAARIITKNKPNKHTDISSILGFSAIVSAFIPVEFYDYRPAQLNLSNLKSGKADLTKLPFEDNSIESLSCMHTIEHVGLGRYGDPIDPNGDIKASKELSRILKEGGTFIFVTPIGKPKIAFNAHRIYSYQQVLDLFPDLKLKEFSMIPDDHKKSGLIINADPNEVRFQDLACGCFEFTK